MRLPRTLVLLFAFAACGDPPSAPIDAAALAQLASTAQQTLDYRDLPSARHHEEGLADPRLLEAFQRFVALETELADLLATAAEQDRQLLRESRPS